MTTQSRTPWPRLVRDRFRAVFGERSSHERTMALKERIYAGFTGLAIVAALALSDHHETAVDALVNLVAGIVGIVAAAFVAEIIAHLVNERALPAPRQLWTMVQIGAGAITSASLPVVVLIGASLGVYALEPALYTSIALYFMSLTAVALLAAHRTRLGWRQRFVASAVLLGSGLVVIVVLIAAH